MTNHEGAAGWPDVFLPFSATHAAVFVVFSALMAVLIGLGRRARRFIDLGTDGQALMPVGGERIAGIGIVIVWTLGTAWWLLPARFDAAESLPLHLCDVAAPIAGLALVTNARALRAILHFWGLGLNTQAFITPLLRAGPAHVEFWVFWLMHAVIVGAALYDLIARRFRPTWRDYGAAVAAAFAYLAVVLPIDIALGFNYGYVGNMRPEHPTIVDALGPWPQRVVVIALLVCAVMAVLMLPWAFIARRHDAKQEAFSER